MVWSFFRRLCVLSLPHKQQPSGGSGYCACHSTCHVVWRRLYDVMLSCRQMMMSDEQRRREEEKEEEEKERQASNQKTRTPHRDAGNNLWVDESLTFRGSQLAIATYQVWQHLFHEVGDPTCGDGEGSVITTSSSCLFFWLKHVLHRKSYRSH